MENYPGDKKKADSGISVVCRTFFMSLFDDNGKSSFLRTMVNYILAYTSAVEMRSHSGPFLIFAFKVYTLCVISAQWAVSHFCIQGVNMVILFAYARYTEMRSYRGDMLLFYISVC